MIEIFKNYILLRSKKHWYEYTNGWSEVYDNIQFKIEDIQYELETAVDSLSYIIDNVNKIGVTVELDEWSNVDELLKESQLKVEMKKLDDISVNIYGVNCYRFEYHDQDLEMLYHLLFQLKTIWIT